MSILAPHASIRNRNEDIEILRGVAIIFILVVHIRLLLIYPSSLYNGFLNLFQLSLGVDLFFVISGFVIANSLQHSLSGSSTSKYRQLLAFWLKRVFRLLPAAWLWLTVTVAIMFVITQNIDGLHQLAG
ncbi:MAG: acyltransferase family protein, partial [Proteobacteria bacterium]|nr:acyltransferase family protein [Pseudomonadota bacterium]